MSKIGIITLPLRLNYGCLLQAYALQTALEREGNDVNVIQIRHRGYPAPKGLMAPFVYAKRAAMRLLRISDIPICAEKQLNEQWPVISAYSRQFVNHNIHLKEVESYNELNPSDYDILVVGSDQVWRPAYSNLNHCFLEFAEKWNVRRIAYAASFGTDEKEYTSEQVAMCKPLIQRFDAVSVREDSGVTLCKEYFGIQAQHVLDPTLLLEKEDYIKLVEDKGIGQSEGNLFVYLLDENEEKKALVNRFAKDNDLAPFSVKAKSDYKYAPVEDRIQPPVEKWLRAFMDAKFVLTDSFHGCVFSLLFNKPFISLGNSSRGMARFNSLFRLFNIENRPVFDYKKTDGVLDNSIDWKSVNHILNCQRDISYFFINSSIQ